MTVIARAPLLARLRPLYQGLDGPLLLADYLNREYRQLPLIDYIGRSTITPNYSPLPHKIELG